MIRRALPATRALRLTALALCAAALAGCATAPATPPDRLHTGRFTATTTGTAPTQSVSGRFSVEVRGTHSIIDVETPLGTTIARVVLAPDNATATGPQMQSVSGPDADALVEQLTGWRLPVSGLPYWVDARPAPDRPARTEGDAARPSLIDQDGWVIRYPEYSAAGVPRSLSLERAPQPPDPGVRVRLLLDDVAS